MTKLIEKNDPRYFSQTKVRSEVILALSGHKKTIDG